MKRYIEEYNKTLHVPYYTIVYPLLSVIEGLVNLVLMPFGRKLELIYVYLSVDLRYQLDNLRVKENI